MARHAAPLKDWLDVAPIFNIEHAVVLFPFDVAEASFVMLVPLKLRFVATAGRNQGRRTDKIPHFVIGPSSSRLIEVCRLLAVRMATTAIVADFTGAKLMPGLRAVQDHAPLVERLEGERSVGRDLCEEACVRIAVRVFGLAALAEFADRNLAKNPHPLSGMIVKPASAVRSTLPVGGRFQRQNANCMDVIIVVKAHIAALIVKVQRHPVAMARERVQSPPWIIPARISSGHFSFRHASVRKTFALAET